MRNEQQNSDTTTTRATSLYKDLCDYFSVYYISFLSRSRLFFFLVVVSNDKFHSESVIYIRLKPIQWTQEWLIMKILKQTSSQRHAVNLQSFFATPTQHTFFGSKEITC